VLAETTDALVERPSGWSFAPKVTTRSVVAEDANTLVVTTDSDVFQVKIDESMPAVSRVDVFGFRSSFSITVDQRLPSVEFQDYAGRTHTLRPDMLGRKLLGSEGVWSFLKENEAALGAVARSLAERSSREAPRNLLDRVRGRPLCWRPTGQLSASAKHWESRCTSP
jgi:hypothetical protein